MSKIRMSTAILILLTIISVKADTTSELGAILQRFAQKTYDKKVAAIAEISDLQFKVYSPMYKDISNVTFSIKTRFGKNKNEIKATYSCILPHDTEIIAPFDNEALDKTRDLKTSEQVFVLLGLKGKECTISHLSKITGGSIQLPAWKEWSGIKVSIPELEAAVK